MSDAQKYGIIANSVEARMARAEATWDDVNGWTVPGDLDLSRIGLSKLPKINSVGGSFYCHENDLETLEGCPANVGLRFNCQNNQLKNLSGGPSVVGQDYICQMNEITSLNGAPQKVNGNFDCSCNELDSLANSPSEVLGEYRCASNLKSFTKIDVKAVCTVADDVIMTDQTISGVVETGEGKIEIG